LRNIHRLTEGAILLAAFTILLLMTVYVPVLGSVVNFFLALPFMMFSARNNRKETLVFLIASLLLSLIAGSFLAIPLTLSYGLTGIVIGDFIRNEKSKQTALIAGSITFLINLVIQYVISIVFLNMDIIKESIQLLREGIDQYIKIMTSLSQAPNEVVAQRLYAAVDLIGILTPTIFVITSFSIVFIIQLVSYPILKRFGTHVVVGELFRDFKLPKSMIYYFLIALLVNLIFQPESGSYVHLALSNILFILLLLIVVQGLSFVWYFSYQKSLSKAIPIIVTIAMFLMPLILYIVWILGIMDLGFDLRKRLNH
jgi:uncharacterized protein YybS (DUF2232 family)